MGVWQPGSPGAYSEKTTEPEGLKPPVSVAASETLPPAGTEPDGVVEMLGAALVTVTCSCGSLEDAVIVVLLASSPSWATQLQVPADGGVKASAGKVPLPLTVTACEWIEVAQVASPGPYRLNVMTPVGMTPPDRVAVSLMLPPTVTPGEAWVASVGVDGGMGAPLAWS